MTAEQAIAAFVVLLTGVLAGIALRWPTLVAPCAGGYLVAVLVLAYRNTKEIR